MIPTLTRQRKREITTTLQPTHELQFDPGVPGGRHLVVHPAPVLAPVPRHHRVQGEEGLADPGRLLVQDVAALSQALVVLPVLARTRARPKVETGNCEIIFHQEKIY